MLKIYCQVVIILSLLTGVLPIAWAQNANNDPFSNAIRVKFEKILEDLKNDKTLTGEQLDFLLESVILPPIRKGIFDGAVAKGSDRKTAERIANDTIAAERENLKKDIGDFCVSAVDIVIEEFNKFQENCLIKIGKNASKLEEKTKLNISRTASIIGDETIKQEGLKKLNDRLAHMRKILDSGKLDKLISAPQQVSGLKGFFGKLFGTIGGMVADARDAKRSAQVIGQNLQALFNKTNDEKLSHSDVREHSTAILLNLKSMYRDLSDYLALGGSNIKGNELQEINNNLREIGKIISELEKSDGLQQLYQLSDALSEKQRLEKSRQEVTISADSKKDITPIEPKKPVEAPPQKPKIPLKEMVCKLNNSTQPPRYDCFYVTFDGKIGLKVIGRKGLPIAMPQGDESFEDVKAALEKDPNARFLFNPIDSSYKVKGEINSLPNQPTVPTPAPLLNNAINQIKNTVKGLRDLQKSSNTSPGFRDRLQEQINQWNQELKDLQSKK